MTASKRGHKLPDMHGSDTNLSNALSATKERSSESIADQAIPRREGMYSGLLRRAGIDQTFLKPRPTVRPSEAHAIWLSDTNPELLKLKMDYAQLSLPVLQRGQWTAEFVAREVPLQNFRGDCGYIWQRRDLNTPAGYVLTAYFLLSGPYASLLRRLTEDGSFGAYSIRLDDSLLLTRDLMDSVNELSFLERHSIIGDRPRTVLDIGSGYGRLAHRIHEAYDGRHKVICVDAIPESTFVCEFYLRYRGLPPGVVVKLPALASALRESPPDIAVSIHVLSECTFTAIEWWLDLLQLNSIRYLFIVPNADQHGGACLLSNEADGSRIPFERAILSRGYKLLACEAKYENQEVQKYGVSPTRYFLFELNI